MYMVFDLLELAAEDLRPRSGTAIGTKFWNQAGVYEGARAGNTRKDWSRGRELNPRPTDYELNRTTYSGHPKQPRRNNPRRSGLAGCLPGSSWYGVFW